MDTRLTKDSVEVLLGARTAVEAIVKALQVDSVPTAYMIASMLAEAIDVGVSDAELYQTLIAEQEANNEPASIPPGTHPQTQTA